MSWLIGRASCLLCIAMTGAVAGGCKDEDPSYDAELSKLASELHVSVHVLGTSDPPTPRRVRVDLEPGPSATIDQDSLCPVVHATATINGVELEQTQFGDYFRTSGQGALSGRSGCEPIAFERELEQDLLGGFSEPTRIEVLDHSGGVRVEGHAFLRAAEAHFAVPEDSILLPGARVELRVEPGVEVLPRALSGYYRAEVASDSFGLDPVTPTATGVAFEVLDSARPSSGLIQIGGAGYGDPFLGIVDVCEGALSCRVERGACWDQRCTTGIAYGPGFDELVLPASVSIP